MLGDFYGCHPTIQQFQAAMDNMLTELQTSLPGIPIYVGAILPTIWAPEAKTGPIEV